MAQISACCSEPLDHALDLIFVHNGGMDATRPTLQDIQTAAGRIAPHVHRTPVMTCGAIDSVTGRKIFMKCENLQKVGAFKARGACNAVMGLDDETAARGVVTHSSGNHAQALAWAAALRGIPAHIVMPTNAPEVKRRGVIGYGGIVHDCKPTVEDREFNADRVCRETGGTLIPPYDDPRIIAGQGTIALELMGQVPDLDAVIAPVGGGGMLSGVAIATRGLSPETRVFAAEPHHADDAYRSMASGKIEPMPSPDTMADGLRTTLGEHTFPVISDLVEEVLLVSEAEIASAMRLVMERAKLVVEPSAVVGIAAACQAAFKIRPDLERVGVVLSGGNFDLMNLANLLSVAER